jgi:hypothetical protein
MVDEEVLACTDSVGEVVAERAQRGVRLRRDDLQVMAFMGGVAPRDDAQGDECEIEDHRRDHQPL